MHKQTSPEKKASLVSKLSGTGPSPPMRQAIRSSYNLHELSQAQARGPPLPYRYEAVLRLKHLRPESMPWGIGLGPYRSWKVEQNFFPAKHSPKEIYVTVSPSPLSDPLP